MRKLIGRLMAVLAFAGWASTSQASIIAPEYAFFNQVGGVQNDWNLDGFIKLKETVTATSSLQPLSKADILDLSLTISNSSFPTGIVIFGLADLLILRGTVFDVTGIYVPFPVSGANNFILKRGDFTATTEQTYWGAQIFEGQPLRRYYSDRFDSTNLDLRRWFEEAPRSQDDNLTVASIKTVPTPSTLAIFGLGLAGLGWSRRKKV